MNNPIRYWVVYQRIISIMICHSVTASGFFEILGRHQMLAQVATMCALRTHISTPHIGLRGLAS